MGELEKIAQFRKDLAIAETIEEIQLHSSAADAMAMFAKKQNLSCEKQNDIGRFRVEVEEKKGQWLDEYFPHGKHEGNQYTIGKVAPSNLSKMPYTKQESVKARKVANAPKELKEEIIERIIEKGDVITPVKLANELKKIERKEKIEEQIEAIENSDVSIDGLYDVVVIDPPWNYGRAYDPEGSRVSNPYPEMDQDELIHFPIPAKEDSILWLWTTQAFIWDAKELLDVWGFSYKAILTWDKQKMGMGSWLRMQTEFCLMATKGNPVIKNHATRDIISEPRRRHSQKPESFYSLVEDLCPGNKIEIFSREKRQGWESYGDES